MIKFNRMGLVCAALCSISDETASSEGPSGETVPAGGGDEMTTIDTTEAPVARKGGADNNYPFATKAAIKARCLAEPDFANACLGVLLTRQTAVEVKEKETKFKNARGFMSSHAVRGTEYATKLKNGEALTGEEQARVQEMTSHYGKQLAEHYRTEMLRTEKGNKELRAAAAKFGV